MDTPSSVPGLVLLSVLSGAAVSRQIDEVIPDMFFLVIAATGVLLFLASGAFLASTYNHLVALKNLCDKGFAQLEMRLRQRGDLVLELIEREREGFRDERETLESIAAAHDQALAALSDAAQNPTSIPALREWERAEGRLVSALGRLRLVIADHPEFQQNQEIAQWVKELTLAENRVVYTRCAYNDWVMDFNSFRDRFPSVYLAPFFGFPSSRPLLDLDDPERVLHSVAVLSS